MGAASAAQWSDHPHPRKFRALVSFEEATRLRLA
jgi:hypothetical protein